MRTVRNPFLIAAFCCACLLSARDAFAPQQNFQDLRKEAFATYKPNYSALRDARIRRAISLGKRVYEREASGENILCAHQILTETKYLLGSSANFSLIDQRLDDLQNVLDHPELEESAAQQDPQDGSWGHCYSEWFLRLDATYEHLNQDSTRSERSKLPVRLLDRVNSPDKLRNYFDSISTSNIARDGIDHRRELNESMADLMRFILQRRPVGYRWDRRLRPVLMDIILHRLRDPKTGWWGERYEFSGRTEIVDDLSVTFHIVRYLNGSVPDLQRIVATTLAVKDQNVPTGWLDSGHFTDHNNMDVAVLFRFGWKSATVVQKRAMAEQIQKMLDWCLSKSLQPDGSFAHGGDDSIEEDTYFGTAFLSRIGFFDRSRRFWTTKDFAEAEEIRKRITSYILQHRNSGAVGGTYYEHALRELNSGDLGADY